MRLINKYLKPLFFSRLFYSLVVADIFIFILSFWFGFLYQVGIIFLLFIAAATVVDYIVLFAQQKGTLVIRNSNERFSNGDQNKIQLSVKNLYSFRININVIDEVPDQFQQRKLSLPGNVAGGDQLTLEYSLRPVQRGEYKFHDIHVFIKSPLSIVVKRETTSAAQVIKVLPSYTQLRQFELRAHASNLEAGTKRMRKMGHSLEFEQIKEYVRGDDIRTMHWKATARKGQLMVNNYADERSQQVYCMIDKGRVMKMPFEGMTLLDHAINATLILSSVALIKQDKAGLVTFADQIGNILPADRKSGQMNSILEVLYKQQTDFLETDFEKLYALIRTRITQRSLIMLFTNFESLTGLQRQLPYIRNIAKHHLLMVVFFQNTELKQLLETKVRSMEELYVKTIAERFDYEKRLIVKELQQHGILSILTTPQNLTVAAVNKYLELKAKRAI